MKRFWDAYLNTFRVIFTTYSSFSTMVFAILLYAVLYPQPYVGEVVRDAPVVMVDQDHSSLSRTLTRRINTTDGVTIVSKVADLQQAKDQFFRREAFGIVVIPPDFQKNLLNGQPSPIAVYGDGSYFLIYSSIVSGVRSAASSLGAEVQMSRLTAAGMDVATASAMISPVTITTVSLFNPQGGYTSYVVPAAFVLILQQTLMMGIGILQSGRKVGRGIEALAAPLAYVSLYLIWIYFSQVLLPQFYSIPKIGDTLTLFMVAIPFLTSTTAMGYVVARLIPWREGVVFFLITFGLLFFFASGVSWPIEEVPLPVRLITLMVPSTSAIMAFVQVDQMGAGFDAVRQAVFILLGLTVFYSAIAVALGAKRLQVEDKTPKA